MDSRSEDDVLSLSAHETWPTEGSELSDLDLNNTEFVIIDEINEEMELETTADTDARMVVDEGIGEPLVVCSSPGAPGPGEASASGGSLAVPEPRSRLRTCYVCGLQTREKIRRHVLRTHLPWFWAASTACWECGEQEVQASSLSVKHHEHQVGCTFDDDHLHLWCLLLNGSLHLLASWLECNGLEELLQYVISRELHVPLRSGFSDQEHQFLMFYVQTYSPRDVPHLTFHPPNHVACLTNWEMMASLLRRVSPSKQERFAKYSECLTFEGSNVLDAAPIYPEPFVFVDTHFHLDMTLKRLRLRNFLHMCSVIAPSDGDGFYYGIANYVFPRYWNDWKNHIGLATTVYVSFGIHPHVAAAGVSTVQMAELEALVSEEICVAVGEIGLDYTTGCSCHPCSTPASCARRMKAQQEEVFGQLLLLAKARTLPAVLHCRDSGDGSAAQRAFEMVHALGCTALKIHRHCFTGDVEELRQWLSLPNVVFGLTWKSVTEIPTVIPRIPPQQFILESDAPFLSPSTCGPTNHPWNLREVAEEVGKLRNIPLSMLNWTVNQNALQFYGIPKTLSRSSQGPLASAELG